LRSRPFSGSRDSTSKLLCCSTYQQQPWR
jgi:hypothetical protein